MDGVARAYRTRLRSARTARRASSRARRAWYVAVVAAVACTAALLLPRTVHRDATIGDATTGDNPRRITVPVVTALAHNATVESVVDGDTVDVRVGTRRARVRLIGVNTPETVDPRRGVECFGPEAKQYTARLLPYGTRIRLERDIEPRDDYGRLLAYVFLASDGAMVNLALVTDGYAVPLRIEPNTAYAHRFRDAALAAQRAQRGLWSSCADARSTGARAARSR